ncbi:uncharacterized protein LOC117890512 [Drosophila subobscura]|uniref:uncharacterized protein LOC117890512 n=1 Tax=Drosophila subobscura TaxID=7241 RepID=UPI00155B0F79|nr:uncharacterized protein LOC117890512 [Drosophila subobscura]
MKIPFLLLAFSMSYKHTNALEFHLGLLRPYGEIPFKACLIDGGMRSGYCIDLSLKEVFVPDTNETITNIQCRVFSRYRSCTPPAKCCTDGWDYTYVLKTDNK